MTWRLPVRTIKIGEFEGVATIQTNRDINLLRCSQYKKAIPVSNFAIKQFSFFLACTYFSSHQGTKMRAMFIAFFVLACCAAVLHAGCCPRTFTYCGSTLNVARLGSNCGIELDPQTLYSCHSNEQPTLVKRCSNRCVDGLAGQNDYCDGEGK